MNDDEWDEWMEMSDAEQDQVLQREMEAYYRMLDSMTVKQKIAHSRRLTLKTCLDWRQIIKQGIIPDLAREYLRERQKRLLELRAWRSTGIHPGRS